MFMRFAVCLVCLLFAIPQPALGKPTEVRRIDTKFKGKITRVVLSGDGKTLAAAAENTVKVFDVAMGAEIATCQGASGPFVLSHDGQQLAFVPGEAEQKEPREVRIWSVAEGKLQTSISKLPGQVLSLAFAPDGLSLALGLSWTDDNHVVQSRVKLFATRTGKEQSELCKRACPDNIPGIIATCGTALAFSPDGKTLAVGGNAGGGADGEVTFCSVFGGREISRGTVPSGMNLEALTFSANGKQLASVGYRATLWDASSGKVLWGQQREVLGATTLAFSGDGKSMLESGSGGIHRYDISSGKLLSKASVPAGVIAISPDGKRLAAAEGAAIVVYETESYFDK